MSYRFNNDYLGITQTVKATNGGTVFTDLVGSAYINLFDSNSVVDDAIYFAAYMAGRFTGINFLSSYFIPMTSTSHTIVWEYFNGTSWVEPQDISDGTNGFTQIGAITWTLPTDWAFSTTTYSTKSHTYLWIRARLTAKNNINDGGRFHSNYANPRHYCLYIDGAESFTPASLYALSETNGWGTIEYDGDRKYTFPNGIYWTTDCTITITGQSLQFGTPEFPCFYLSSAFVYSTWIVNADTNYKASNVCSHFEYYVSNIYGNTMTLGASGAGSQLNNIMFTLYTNAPTKTYGSIYRVQYFGAYASDGQDFNNIFNCTVYNRANAHYERVSMPDVQYLLSGAGATYKNMYFRNWVRVDPTYFPVIEDSVFDYGTSPNSTWMNIGTAGGTSAYHGFLETIGCEFPNGNKYYPVDYLKRVGDYDFHLRQVYSNRLNINVTDDEGNVLENAKVEMIDSYGEKSLYTQTTMYIAQPMADTDTIITVNDSTDFVVGKYYRIAAEVMLLVSKPTSTTIEVVRGQMNTRRKSSNYANESFVLFDELQDYIMTDSNGDIPELKVMETCFYRNGGLDTVTYNYFTPFTITISKAGYEDYVGVLPITEKTTETIALQKIQIPAYENLSVDIEEDEINVVIG